MLPLPRRRRWLLLATLLTLTTTVLAVPPAAHAQRRNPVTIPPVVPVRDDVLPHRAHGADAVRMLGTAGLETAAARNGMAASRLRSLLEQDSTTWLGTEGQLYYVEPSPTAVSDTAAASTATAPLSDTFRLHSLPGAQRTIYLDFDGSQVQSTWANDQLGLLPTTEPAWDPANNGAAFSDSELAQLQEVWARVAEDYAPFSVDVTTEQPSSDALNRSGAGDQTYGVQVLVGPSHEVWSTLCNQGCGGIAPLGVFDDYYLTSDHARYAWVFTDGLADFPKYVAEAAAHEAGHTLGLHHDGSATDPNYYEGTSLWGPIMGAPYDSAVTQWSKGEYAGANNVEDDLAMIGAPSMAPPRTDEAGATVATAAAKPTGPAVITSASDVDVYDLGNCAGTLTATATPATLGPDLDISLALLDSDGAVVAAADPAARAQVPGWPQPVYATGLGATVTTSSATGRHLYARVRGAAAGGWSTGYGSYGSIGAYRLSVSGCAAPTTVAAAPTNLVAAPDPAARTLTATWTAPASSGGSAVTGYQVQLDGSSPQSVTQAPYVFRGVATGSHQVTVRAVNAVGPGPAATVGVTMPAPPTVPGTLATPTAVASPTTRSVTLTWAPPANDGGSAITAYRVHQYDASGADLGVQQVAAEVTRATLSPVGLGQTVRFGISAVNAAGEGPVARGQVTMPSPTPVVRVPGAPTIGRVTPGPRGGRITVLVRWAPPRSDGGAAIAGYRVALYQLNDRGRVVRTTYVTFGVRTSANIRVALGKRYRFAVQARNRVGYGAFSARSTAVRGR